MNTLKLVRTVESVGLLCDGHSDESSSEESLDSIVCFSLCYNRRGNWIVLRFMLFWVMMKTAICLTHWKVKCDYVVSKEAALFL